MSRSVTVISWGICHNKSIGYSSIISFHINNVIVYRFIKTSATIMDTFSIQTDEILLIQLWSYLYWAAAVCVIIVIKVES